MTDSPREMYGAAGSPPLNWWWSSEAGWQRLPFVDRYGNAWNGHEWLPNGSRRLNRGMARS
ncbi:MAG: hypothetical protein ACYDCS_01060 [Candidatus Dormibacteria bacterium]